MKNLKSLLVVMMFLFITLFASGCIREYDVPEFVEITPSQTAFLLPLEGKTSQQGKFESEAYLEKNMVASKRIQIPHRWQQMGRFENDGKWIPTHRLIIVERKPITREWTEDTGTGTEAKNQGIVAESKNSIGFLSRWNGTAQIMSEDGVRYLYLYNDKTLAEVMDTEIRPMVESAFVSECGKRDIANIISNKSEILDSVQKTVIPYFKSRGITISVLGMKGEFTYLNPEIQKSIDMTFKAKKDLEAQRDINAKKVEQAQAEAKAAQIAQQNMESLKKLRELDIEMKKLDVQLEAVRKWNGSVPQYLTGGQGMMFNIPIK